MVSQSWLEIRTQGKPPYLCRSIRGQLPAAAEEMADLFKEYANDSKTGKYVVNTKDPDERGKAVKVAVFAVERSRFPFLFPETVAEVIWSPTDGDSATGDISQYHTEFRVYSRAIDGRLPDATGKVDEIIAQHKST